MSAIRHDSSNVELLGLAIERLDNIAHAIQLPIAPAMHVQQMQLLLPDVVKQLKEAFVKVTGENPWEGEPR